MPQIS
jgi:hypothetical protein